ncbi:MAG: hypothetical protein QNL33_18870 [Akkermansiaceae bacterium]|jgi:hypothetical protein
MGSYSFGVIEDEPQYDVVLKMVLWDEGRETIFHRLKVNGIEGERAEGIYKAARRERVAAIRGAGRRDLLIGMILIAICAAVTFGLGLDKLSFTHFSEGFGEVLLLPWLITMLVVICFAFGLWRCLRGVTEILLAPSKTGSIAD